MIPFLKWAGGKRWLSRQVGELLPLKFGTYIEPFLGSGAIFFDLCPPTALLSDANKELIETYRTVRDFPREVLRGLRALHKIHSEEIYYAQRSSTPSDKIRRAVRFIYLNRTCWNGLYRVNKKNEFNVPIGTKTTVVMPDDDFQAIAAVLSKAKLRACDFEDTIDAARAGDLIYVDPPYTVKHNMNGFLKYNQTMFSWDDQIRLHACLVRAKRRGSNIIVSNADHKSVRELYADFDVVRQIPRASIIAGDAGARGHTSELLVIHHG
jgi:DNA adenine methylase